MRSHVPSIQAQAEAQAAELLRAIEVAEGVIISTIERECEALRAGRTLAADALRMRLRDGARLYLNLARAARASVRTFDMVLPGVGDLLEERRAAFSAMLKVELAVLSAEREAAHCDLAFADAAPQRPAHPARQRVAPAVQVLPQPHSQPHSQPRPRRRRLRRAS